MNKFAKYYTDKAMKYLKYLGKLAEEGRTHSRDYMLTLEELGEINRKRRMWCYKEDKWTY